MNFAMATLGLKEMQKKSGIMKSGLDAKSLFFLDDLLRRLEMSIVSTGS